MASLFGFGKSSDSNANTDSSTVNNSGTRTSAGTTRTANAEQAGEVHENSVANNASRGGSSTTTTTTTTGGNTGMAGGRAHNSSSQYGSNSNSQYDSSNQYAAGTATAGNDDAMTRSEERLNVGKESVDAGKARLHKYVTTEQVQTEVPLKKESVTLEREPITEQNRNRAMAGPEIKEAEYEVNLQAERPVVEKETVPLERVRLNKQAEQTTQTVGGEVRKEHIEYGTTPGVQTNTVGANTTAANTRTSTRGA